MKLLIVVVVFLGLLAAAQLLKIYELSSRLRGKSEADITDKDNKANANLMLLFGFVYQVAVIWSVYEYGLTFVRPSASLHGESIDSLLLFNWIIIGLVFFITQSLLFFFSYKYVYSKDRMALYLAHNNKLELIWTIIPAITLAVIVIYGLITWIDITGKASEDSLKVELYSKQFDWTARYAGEDNKFGVTNFNVISGTNPLGIVTKKTVADKLVELDELLSEARADLNKNGAGYSDRKIEIYEDKIRNLRLHKNRVLQIDLNDERLSWGYDDQLMKGEFHLPVGREIDFSFRSRDVIHSALMFDFRAQMNCVPGMTTKFKFIPTISTDSMRTIVGDEKFNYKLTCNKICGAAHWNMAMDIIVEDQESYSRWSKEQKTFVLPQENKVVANKKEESSNEDEIVNEKA